MLRADIAVGLRDFTLDVAIEARPGRVTALTGPSGAGKTTVLRAIAGLVRPDGGRVECGGRTWTDVAGGIHVAPEERRCPLLGQDDALFPGMRAWQNVAYGMHSAPRRERRLRAVALLERFGVAHLAGARPRDLSGGERRRVALARALAPEPRALLLDEPLTALDVRTREDAQAALATLLRTAEIPVVLVTHDFAEAATLAAHVAVIDRGRIVQHAAPADLVASPGSEFVARLTGASVLRGTASGGSEGLTAVTLDGGGKIVSPDSARGRVVVVVAPADVVLEPASTAPGGSARNRLAATVTTVTPLAARVRVGLATPAPLTAEVTAAAAAELHLVPGAAVLASWKATATRLVPVPDNGDTDG